VELLNLQMRLPVKFKSEIGDFDFFDLQNSEADLIFNLRHVLRQLLSGRNDDCFFYLHISLHFARI
jgi:hypothetical protein